MNAPIPLWRFWLAAFLSAALLAGVVGGALASLPGAAVAKLMGADKRAGMRHYLWPALVTLLLAAMMRG